MEIDWTAFTPAAALAGGALIGLAAALFIVLNGRIAGISGILGGVLKPRGLGPLPPFTPVPHRDRRVHGGGFLHRVFRPTPAPCVLTGCPC